MELVDIIDENNNLIGTETKENAHSKGLLHRCIIAELRDKSGNWIFVKQSSNRQDKGQLASAAGGHIQSNEPTELALKREVREELGILKFEYHHKGDVIFKREVNGHLENHFFIVYEIESDEKITLNEESDEYVRLSPASLSLNLKSNPNKFGAALIFILKKFYPEVF